MKKKPRILRNRHPKQIDLSPLMEFASAGRNMADGLSELAMATHRVDTHLRGAFLVGIATGPNELDMSAEAVMRIPSAFPYTGDDGPVVPGSIYWVPLSPNLQLSG